MPIYLKTPYIFSSKSKEFRLCVLAKIERVTPPLPFISLELNINSDAHLMSVWVTNRPGASSRGIFSYTSFSSLIFWRNSKKIHIAPKTIHTYIHLNQLTGYCIFFIFREKQGSLYGTGDG